MTETMSDTRARFEAAEKQARNEFSHYLRTFHGCYHDTFYNREYLLGIAQAFVKAATDAAIERCAEVAEKFVGGFSATVRVDEAEPEMVGDDDGPWVLNSDIAAALRELKGKP